MHSLDNIKDYCICVCEQIRWKKAHPYIARELEDHLFDQRNSYIADGEDEKTATKKAIAQMGDAAQVGLMLDKTHRPKPQWLLIFLTITLILTGTLVRYLIMTFRESDAAVSVLPTILTIIVFLAAYFLDFTAFAKYPKAGYFTLLILSFVCLLVAPQVNGRAYFFLRGWFSFPLHYLTLIFPLAYSLFIYAMRNNGAIGILLCGAAYIPYAVLLLLASSTTAFFVFTFTALLLLLVAIKRGWFGKKIRQGMLLVLIPTAISILPAILLLLRRPYLLARLSILLTPDSNPSGYQILMIRKLIEGAVMIGGGTFPQEYDGMLTSSWFRSDMILTVLTNQYGWLALMGILLLFFVFSAICLRYISKQRSMLGLLVATSIVTIFVLQVVLYVSMNMGYGLSALSLPFISDGNTVNLLNAGLIGLLLSVFRTGEVVRDEYRLKSENTPLFSYEDGKLIINFKRQIRKEMRG